jgi:hypothetical protein
MGFVVDKVALGQSFLPVLRGFPPVSTVAPKPRRRLAVHSVVKQTRKKYGFSLAGYELFGEICCLHLRGRIEPPSVFVRPHV